MMFSMPKNVRLASLFFLAACQTDLHDAPDDSGLAPPTADLEPPSCSGSIDFQAAALAGERSQKAIAILTVSSDAPKIRFTELQFRVHGPRVITSAQLSAAGEQVTETLASLEKSDLESDVLDFRFDHALERNDAAEFPALVVSAGFADSTAYDEQPLQVTLEYAKATGLFCSYNVPIDLQPLQLETRAKKLSSRALQTR